MYIQSAVYLNKVVVISHNTPKPLSIHDFVKY